MHSRPVRPAFPFLCRSCRRWAFFGHRRRFSSDVNSRHDAVRVNKPSPPLASAPAYARLTNRRLIHLSGRDAAHFLQGLVTVNVTSALQSRGGPGLYAAFLNAAGRVLFDVFIYPVAGSRTGKELESGKGADEAGFLIEVDAKQVDSLAAHLRRFKLRSKVQIRALDDGEWNVWSLWDKLALEDEGSSETDTHHSSSASRDDMSEGPGEIGCGDSRAPDMGRRLILPYSQNVQTVEANGIEREEVPHQRYDIRRMLLGVAEGQDEIIKESALPQESNIDYMGGIDFRKGCYVGQELTIRTHHTGVVRKRILPVQLYGSSSPQPEHGKDEKIPESLSYNPNVQLQNPPPPAGTSISLVDGKGRSVGRWIGGIGNIGLALCRLEVMTNTSLTGEGVQWRPEHEFKIAWDDHGVRVKAFVPPWHQLRADTQRVQRH